MDNSALYKSKLTTPEEAVAATGSGTTISMGMAMSEPPALLGSLAARVQANELHDVNIYYFESTKIAGNSILR
jgi:itaconate CoA-transferase